MKKRLLTIMTAALAATCSAAMLACGNGGNTGGGARPDDDPPPVKPVEYTLDFADCTGGVVWADKTEYGSGDAVDLTVKAYYGYELTSLKVDGRTVTVTDGAYSFTMPANNVNIEPTFTCTADTKQLPDGNYVTVESYAPITGGIATAKIFANIGADKVTVTAYVTDAMPVVGKDGLRLYFGTSDFADRTLSGDNIAVETAIGEMPVVKTVVEGRYVTDAEYTGVTVEYEPWSVRGGEVCGYVMTLGISYDNLGVTASDAAGKLTLLPYLANSDNIKTSAAASASTIDDYYSYTDPDTYLVVTSSAIYNNRYMFGKGAVGSYKKTVTAGSKWDTSNDHDVSDTANYASREIRLTGNDGRDNNIAFFGSAGKTSFVKATFTVDNVYNADDRYPKFGLMAFDTEVADSGVFFYVDAEMSGTSGNTVNSIIGTKLGCSTITGGRWNNDWKNFDSTLGSFNILTKSVTLGMLVKGNFVYMFRCTPSGDTLVGAAIHKTSGDMVIGIKCFGLGLKVTDYEVTADGESELYTSHNTRADGTTIGDNLSGYAYTDGWSFDGDVAQNSGSGDQLVYVKGASESETLYAHASVTTPGKCGNTADAYTKVGAALVNDDYIVFGYIDLADGTSAGNRTSTNFAVMNRRTMQWSWEVASYSYKVGVLVESEFVDIGMVKLGENMCLTVNGEIVAAYVDPTMADKKFVVGILGFNRSMTVKDGAGTSDINEVREQLGITVPADIKPDGVLDDAVWTTGVLSNAVTFDASRSKGTKIEVVAVKGTTGVYVAAMLYTQNEQAKVSSNSWGMAPNVAFRFGTSGVSQFVALFDTINGDVTTSMGVVGAASRVEEIEITSGKKGYKTTIEFFVPYKQFTGYTAEAEKLPFYVWSFRMDNNTIAAMQASSYDKNCFVTAQGLVLEDK